MRCAIYTRVSTDNQAEVEFNSCEAQTLKIKSFINSQENMEIFKVYSDPGFTGDNLNRPALQELLKDVRQKKVDLVISYKIDRLTRSPKDFYHLIEILDRHEVNFISVTERFDTSTPSGRLLRNIMLTFAQFERELTNERTRDKLLERAQKDMWNGGGIPFGYKTENKKLVIDGPKARIVRNIYETYILHSSIAKVFPLKFSRKTLASLTKPFQSCRGIEKNLLAQKFIKSIIYSKELIQLNLFSPPVQKEKFRSEGAENPFNSVRNNKNGCSSRSRTNHIIPIILPNQIHASRKKNL